MIELDIAAAETIGARAEQQDATAIVPLGPRGEAALLVLADGLGGHADGAKAARIVVETFKAHAAMHRAFDVADHYHSALDEALQEANQRIQAASNPADGARSMGSTAVAAVIAAGRLRWISVGDSHLYVWRRGRLAKLNADHSQAGIMIRQGHDPSHPAVLRVRSLLASALTGRTIEHIDSPPDDLALAVGDVILLASDGLDTLAGLEIARTIDDASPRGAKAIADALVGAVLTHALPRQDNTAVIAARILGSHAPANADDEVPHDVPIPTTGPFPGAQTRWPVAVGLAVLLAVIASVIMTQIR